jgi:hypothetical protein
MTVSSESLVEEPVGFRWPDLLVLESMCAFLTRASHALHIDWIVSSDNPGKELGTELVVEYWELLEELLCPESKTDGGFGERTATVAMVYHSVARVLRY